MFYTLLLVTFIIAAAVSWITTRVFDNPAKAILKRIIQDEISTAWSTYLRFALYVVGIADGVRIVDLERYISAPQWNRNSNILELTPQRWVLEVYRTVIGTLQGLAWVLLVFFVVALIAFVLVRLAETWRKNRDES